MKCKLTFIKLTLNLHLNTSKFPNLGHLLKKTIFFFHFFYSFKKFQTHTSWDRFFRSYVKEFDGWKAPSHAKQLDHFFPGHRFEIWEGPSDWLTVGRIAFFVLNKFGKTIPLVIHWLWVVGAILSIISRLGNPQTKIYIYTVYILVKFWM